MALLLRRLSTALRVAGAVLLVVSMLGCVGGSLGSVMGLLLLVAGLGLGGCAIGRDDESCDGTWRTYDECIGGEVVELEDCCPAGAICNYGFPPPTTCPDGTCIAWDETCGDDPEECDGTWETACIDHQPEPRCCPTGMACNYGMGVEWCADGSCADVLAGERCPETCDGEMVTYDECVDGQPVSTTACCPAGAICNFGFGTEYCDDGSCANLADGETCPETCDGTWETACVDHRAQPACCPAGMACNFGMGVEWCEDGSCADVIAGESCPETCDGEMVTYNECVEHQLVPATACCPTGMACNFGFGIEYCADGSCADMGAGEACP